MKVMGHRGAAGLALENTKQSIETAIELGVDSVEIDIRKTRDNQLVVCHDDNLDKVAGQPIRLNQATVQELQTIPLHDGSHLLTLREALLICQPTPVMVEIKDSGSARLLVQVLRDFPNLQVRVASFKHGELALVHDLNSRLPIYGLERTKPFDILHTAKIFDFHGIGLNHWLLNPLTYFRARFMKLDLYVYTVNSRPIGWFIRFFYPGVTLCTNYPDRFILKHHK